MSETSAQEPTMEEILASIRRIISEDDAAAGPPAAAAPVEPPPQPVAANAEDDVLELTDKVEPTPEPVAAAPEPPPAPAPEPAPATYHALDDLEVHAPAPEPAAMTFDPAQDPSFGAPSYNAGGGDEEPLVGGQTSDFAASHFGQLAQLSMPKKVTMPDQPGVSLEDVVRELLRPLLRDWLDQHLGPIVEARVQAEVERISRLQG